MGGQFRIIKKEIDEKKALLLLRGEGTAKGAAVQGKLRVLVLFSCGGYTRRFPMDADCFTVDGTDFFSVKAQISLPDVFYRFEKKGEQEACVAFAYCNADGAWEDLDASFFIAADYFLPRQEKVSTACSVFQKISYVLCTLLLPVWLFTGFFVAKGERRTSFDLGNRKGKSAAFYFAHCLVKEATGYGYSMRELKTHYFARAYRRACKKYPETAGIFLLSERKAELDGNLDLVRRGLTERKIAFTEFLDERPVDKLPFQKLRSAARLAARARVIVLEDFYPQLHALTLREDTQVVQLWHACGAFKMFGLSDIGKTAHLTQDTKNHRSYTAAIVSSAQMVPFYSEAFGISEQCVYPLGVPRTDLFFSERYRLEVTERLYARYPQLKGKRVVLFAPTFRGSGNKDAFYPPDRLPVDDFLNAMPADAVLVIKQHPFVKQPFLSGEVGCERVLDLTGKENINDILFITSLLITDYSSCIFEASLLSVPLLFYVFDLEEYLSTRDLYFDLTHFAPGKMARDFDALKQGAKEILNGEADSAGQNAETFRSYFLGALDGHSTERVLDFLCSLV